MEINLRYATERDLEKWDSLVDASINGTIFHKRSFLSYHGTRFLGQEHFLVFLKGESITALAALAINDNNGELEVRSPYGGSYGGIVYLHEPSFSYAENIISAFKSWLIESNVKRCIITPSISICSETSLDVMNFSMLTKGFSSLNRDISSVVRLQCSSPISSRMSANARNMAKKARNAGVYIEHDANIESFWPVMEATFEKHGAKPTHNKNQLTSLLEKFPGCIRIHIAAYEDLAIAGICEFEINSQVNSSFYFCQDPSYRHKQGLSLLVSDALERSEANGFKFYDFGTSTIQMHGRPNIFKFKESYGAEGYFRETFEWKHV